MEKENKKLNPFLWFLFAIVIPLIIVSSLTILILGLAGYDVSGWAKNTANNIPIVSSFVKTDEEKDYEQMKQEMEEKLEKKDAEIKQLENLTEDLETTIDQLNQEILKLENKLESNEQLSEEQEELVEGNKDELRQIARSFQNMKSKQAAAVLENMDQNDAIHILKEISNDGRGKILEAMDPKKAAELTKLFMNE